MDSKISSKGRTPPPKFPKPKIQSPRLKPPFLFAANQYEPVTLPIDADHPQKPHQKTFSSSAFPHKGAATADVTEPLYQEVEGMVEPISLSEVVEKHSQDLPIVVQIKRSLYGVCDTISLVEGELLNLHFLKETKCIQVSATSGKQFSIPIDSTIQFSPVHEVSGNLDITKQESIFSSLEELILSKPLPPAVCVMEQYGDASTHVAVGDILVPKTVKRKTFSDRYLECYNTKTSEEVVLSGKSKIKFSTNPTLLKLYLPEFIHHIKLPQKAAVTFSDEHQEDALGRTFRDQLCTIVSMQTELSFIATFTRRSMDRTLIEIPSTVDIKVSVQRLADIAKRQLRDETNDVCKNFDQRKVGAYISTEEHSQANLHLRAFVHQGSQPGEKPAVSSSHEEFADYHGSPGLTDNSYDYVEFTPGPAQQATRLESKGAQGDPSTKDAPGTNSAFSSCTHVNTHVLHVCTHMCMC